MKVGFLSGLNNLLHADTACVISILNILRNAAVKQHGLLGHYANLTSQEGHIDCVRRAAINQLKVKDDKVKTELMALEDRLN